MRKKESAEINSDGVRFVPCTLIGPDGQSRPGWELWVNEVYYGRADSKEPLEMYYHRVWDPPESHHWRAEKNMGPFFKRFKKIPPGNLRLVA